MGSAVLRGFFWWFDPVNKTVGSLLVYTPMLTPYTASKKGDHEQKNAHFQAVPSTHRHYYGRQLLWML
jgi:hypothetical protein